MEPDERPFTDDEAEQFYRELTAMNQRLETVRQSLRTEMVSQAERSRDQFQKAFTAGMMSARQQHEFLTFDSWFENFLEGLREHG